MRRLLWLCLAIAAIAWLEFEIFPGHTYLHSATQIYLPMLQRIDSPGYLSRDLVATNPNLSYTIYDEVTLFLHRQAHLDFEKALLGQLFLFRLAAVTGIFLLARSTGLRDAFCLLVAALVNLGAALPGPALCIPEPEPVPIAFACGATLLATGLLVRAKPFLSGLAGSLALLYDPVIAAPFWAVVLAALFVDRSSRKAFRPALPALLVSILLLANLAQLQPEVSSEQLWMHVFPGLAKLQQFRSPYLWVSLWKHEMWHYLALAVCGVWAATRVWWALNRETRWLLPGMGLAGIVSVALSYFLLEQSRLVVAAAMQPARTLMFPVIFTSFLCALAALQALVKSRKKEALAWFTLVVALPFDGRILDFLKPVHLGLLALAAALSALFTWSCTLPRAKFFLPVSFLLTLAVFTFLSHHGTLPHPTETRASVLELADWADKNTWGGSMFLFPDAGRELYPGVFRARSRRALWVDWKSGMATSLSQPAAQRWFERWQSLTEGSPAEASVDYYVFKREHALANKPTIFQNGEFCVYDALELK